MSAPVCAVGSSVSPCSKGGESVDDRPSIGIIGSSRSTGDRASAAMLGGAEETGVDMLRLARL
jgi:hypothetical protein